MVSGDGTLGRRTPRTGRANVRHRSSPGSRGPTSGMTCGTGRGGPPMPEEFEFREMKGASFWGVDLEGATFRDVDLTGVAISHARVVDVSIDAFVERLTVNGVDVTDFVNQHDT